MMEQLLYRLQNYRHYNNSSFPFDAVTVAFTSVVRSSIVTQLMMESLVWCLKTGDIEYEDLKIFDGMPWLMTSLAAALHRDAIPDYDDYQRYILCDEGRWSQGLPMAQYSELLALAEVTAQ
jgi:hypothetical protein